MNTQALATGHAVDTFAADTAATANDILNEAGPTISVPDYALVTGISRDTAYRLAARNELGVRILRLGRAMRIPTADVRRQLGLDDSAA